MLLPSKHLTLSESLIGLGAQLLKLLDAPLSIDELWWKFQKVNNTKRLAVYHDFDNVILALNFLYSIKAVNIDDEGRIINEASMPKS
jgi:hypothetical protein